MKKVFQLVENIVAHFEETHKRPDGPEELLKQVENLVKILEEARYFGFRSIGGNASKPPTFISPKEFALIDHISVMYSSAQAISKLLSHECSVRAYERSHETEDKQLKEYILDVEEDDRKLIIHRLNSMKKRMELFNKFYGNIIR